MRRSLRFLALLAAAAFSVTGPGSLRADLDLEVPTGSPFDWDDELHQPTPVIKTGIPGRRAPKVEEPKEKPGRGRHQTRVVRKKPTVRPTPPPPMNFSMPNLYNYFRITTMDIMNHVSPNPGQKNPTPISPPDEPLPPEPPQIETGKSSADLKKERKREKPPNVRMRHGVQGEYPPRIPGELAWLALAAKLRAQIHPLTVNKYESIAYLLEIGEPSFSNAADMVNGLITDVPANLPPYPKMKNDIDKMLSKIIVLELISGYPLSMDPTYAKRTMMMGELALPTIIECTKSPHTFLARNATAVLANMQGKEAAKALRDLFKRSSDLCIQIRCAAGFARKRDKEAVKLLKAAAMGGHNALRVMAIHALGACAVGDKKIGRFLANALGTADEDLQWTILSAIARMHTEDKAVARSCAALMSGLSQYKDTPLPSVQTPPGQAPGMRSVVQDPPNSKKRILYECALLAAAASGDKEARQAALAKSGIDAWHPQCRLLAAEVTAYLGKEGRSKAKGFVGHKDTNVGVAATRAIGQYKEEVDWLKSTAQNGPNAMVKAAALAALFQHDQKALVEAARAIVRGGVSGADGAQAFLVGMALQMLDRLDKNEGDAVLKIVDQAHKDNLIAKRVATDEYDVTKAKIDVYPPLLELAVLALGTTAYEPGLAKLIELSKDSPVKAEACLALGSYNENPAMTVKAAEALLQKLIDPTDGFVRFAAYLSLKHLSGKDYMTDYVFGNTEQIWRQAQKYRDWLVEYKQKYLKGNGADGGK